MEDEKVIVYLARKIWELEMQLKCVQPNCDYYYNLAQKHKRAASENIPCRTMDLN